MAIKLEVKNLYKVFGEHPERAFKMIEEGKTKEQIFEKTGLTLGVKNASLAIEEGEIFVIMGLSGSGKSTMVRLLNRLIEPTRGEVLIDGEDIAKISDSALRTVRRNKISMVFQSFALMPHLTVLNNTAFGMELAGVPVAERNEKALDALRQVGLEKYAHSYPDELSGGMRQRVMIAMALLCQPKLLIADEPTTALDVTVQAQIMTLLNELKREFNTAIIMITHDLGVVAGICDKVLVMYAGRTMEYGSARDVFYQPTHPYSIGLLNAVPRLDAEGETLMTIPGNPPNLLRLPKGCPFQPRCPYAMEICSNAPPLERFGDGRLRACFKPVEELV